MRCGVVTLQEETLLSFCTGKVRDEIGEHRAEIPLGGIWGWEVVTCWPYVHPLSASHHPRDSFVMPVPAGCPSVLLPLLGVLAGPGEFFRLVWWEFGDFGLQSSPEEVGRRWPDSSICCSWLLAATSSRYPAGLRAGGREAQTLRWCPLPWCPLPWCPLYLLFFLGSFFRPLCPGGRNLVSACWLLLRASLWGRKGQQLCWGQRLELKEGAGLQSQQ